MHKKALDIVKNMRGERDWDVLVSQCSLATLYADHCNHRAEAKKILLETETNGMH